MVLILSLLCAATCLWAIAWKIIKIRKCTEPVQGVFIGTCGYSGKVYSPIVTLGFLFRYTYQGATYQGVQSINSVSTITFNRTKFMEKLGYQKGNTYTVFINPTNPKQYKTKNHDSNLLLWFGFVFFICMAYLSSKYM